MKRKVDKLARASAALDRAIEDMLRALTRIKALRRRIRALEIAARIPAEERSARAMRAVATRRRRRTTRQIDLEE